MASKIETVRISYKELENTAREKDKYLGSSHEKEIKDDEDTQNKSKRHKRPTRGIYQPPSRLRHRNEDQGGENWEDELEYVASSDSKENSVEREVEDVQLRINEVNINKGAGDNFEKRSNHDAKKQKAKTGKRPEIKIYVPKGKILEQQKGKDDTEESHESVNDDAQDTSPRKIAVKSDLKDFKVTVVNEKVTSPTTKTPGPSNVNKGPSNANKAKGSEQELPSDPVNPLARVSNEPGHQRSRTPNEPSSRSGGHNEGPQFSGKPRGQRDYGSQSKLNQRDDDSSKEKDKVQRTDNRSKGHYDEKNRQGRGNRYRQPDERGSTEKQRYDMDRSYEGKGKGPAQREDRRQNTSWGETNRGEQKGQNMSQTKMRTEAPKPQRVPRERKARSPMVEQTSAAGTGTGADQQEVESIINNIIPTMVFERRSSPSPAAEITSTTNEVLKDKPPKAQSGNGKPGSKRYSLSAMRRPRAGSVSSDVSTTSDLSIDEETTTRILNWDQEVEREMALQVQDETMKLKEFLEQQGDFNDWDAAIKNIDRAREDLERNKLAEMQSSMEEDRFYRNRDPRDKHGYRHSRSRERDYGEGYGRKSSSREELRYDDGPRQRRNSEGSRSRNKDRRRKGSLNGRRSRDSSVSSVHSVRSYQGDEENYGTDSWPRRRNRRRKNSNSSMTEGSSREFLNDPGSLNLKVTFARDDKRQVMMKEPENQRGNERGRGRGGGRGRGQKRDREGGRSPGMNQDGRGYKGDGGPRYMHDNRGHRDRQEGNRKPHMDHDREEGRRDSRWNQEGKGRGQRRDRRYEHEKNKPGGSGSEQISSTHGGGLIKLPSNTELSESGHTHGAKRNIEFTNQGHRGERARTNPRESQNPSGQRHLFDPKNPNKPILVPGSPGTDPSSLKFKDTGGHESPQSPQPPVNPGFPPMPFRGSGFPPFYPVFDPRFPEGPYPPPPMPGYFYGYPGPQYRDNALYHEDAYNRETSRDFEADQMHAGNSRSQCRVMAERNFQEALHLDSQLANLLSRRISGEGLQALAKLRHDLQYKYEQIILLDPDVSNKHNVEQLLWKSVYYQVIEVFRRQLAEEKDEETKAELNKVLDEGTSFFDKLLQKLQQTYNFGLDVFLDTNHMPPDNISRSIKLALLSAQRTMINLGDIARYREQCSENVKVNYGRARSWYTKAQQLAPKNGRPYNQLAILALYTRRKLDAVYFYMRSLAASNPFLTARESLMSLFDEARKKAEAAEKKREVEKENIQKKRKQQHGHRIEIWIALDGTSSEDKVDADDTEDLSKLEAVELNKRFNLSFLNVHGKLFTKIGRESFQECCSQMLREFQALLKFGALGPSRLIQLMAINMFAIENTALKDESMAEDFRSELQEHAVQLGLDMFGILLDRCADLLGEHLESSDYPAHMFSRELEELVPGVKKWTDWMICNASLWNPPPCIRDTALGPDVDVWKVTAKLVNILKDIDISHVKLYQDKREGCDPVILFEDTMLAGFVPLLSAPMETSYVHSTVEKDIAKDCLRIEKLQLFGEYLCGIEPPMLAYNVETKQYYSVAPSINYSEEGQGDLPSDSEEEEAVIIESETELLEAEEDMDEDEHVRQLKQKKEELKKKKEQQLKEKENIQKIIEKNRHRCIELEIHPIFLVPDTNCFIDHLTSLHTLIQQKRFTVVVPLIVINELDGLAKGSKEGQYESADHAARVWDTARKTVEFLEEEFDKKNTHLKALTSKGTVMETISFRSEESDNGAGNNDDLILSCCLHYCNDKAREYMPKSKDAPVRLYRDVVLLTDDRNLRLKAHTCNVPVKDVPSFIKWSKIS